jgi:hypothetical protein
MLNAMIKVATPSEIPIIEIADIRFINRESFFEKIYLLEIKKGTEGIYLGLIFLNYRSNLGKKVLI